VDEALEEFAAIEPRKAELVKLRYFTGMTFEEAASVLGIAVPTAKEWWAYARAWLAVALLPCLEAGGPLSPALFQAGAGGEKNV
jgi:DNA-directed RNA polymerase specialized sigma24 family protein